ncbi:restriction endonuclease subunit S [Vibrio metoecus]|uniref:restriction endonuclease subunit S n=1 Tax=Vibrio metoecus TaxID=1481663 RepID=UPI000BA914A0|nr:restriction endonuclease subunit S [Vibrio metoecus]PAR26764.1 type I restriction endonuclease subunit S [Vibrio metoecus]PAR63372.1 type I restriction endonuclease subunit S [Vibrio metoecus]
MTAVNLEGVGFKQTEIGCIPSDWHVVSLGSVASKITDGTHDTPKQMKEGIPFLTAIHVKENRIDFDSCYFVSEEVHKEIFRRCNPESGDILMVNIGAGTATTAVVNVPYEFSLKNVALIKPDINNNGRYINYALQFTRNKTLESLATGGAQPFLSLSQIARLIIARPTKLEQTAIANALSDVDALIQELEKLIAKKQAIKTATMQQLLTGRTRLPQFAHHPDGRKKGYKPSELGEIPEDWEVKTLNQIAAIRSGGTPSTSNNKYWDGDINWCTPTDITSLKGRKYLSSTARKITALGVAESAAEILPIGTVVMTSRATIGECAITAEKMSTNQGFKSFICNSDTDNEFVYYLLSILKDRFIELCSGSTFLEISTTQVRGVSVATPAKTEQREIAIILSDMDQELQTLKQRLNKTRQIKQGMMHELLTGKTRLVKPAGAA